MSFAAAAIYWVIVALWAAVLSSVIFFFARNPKTFGVTRLLLFVVGIDAFRNIFENVYFGVYFGGQYGFFSGSIVGVLGQPALLLLPKITFGHDAGDHVLRSVANVLTSAKRASDVVARTGGEEFAILLPETGKEAALVTAQRVRQQVQACECDIAGEKLRVTISIGVAAATVRTSGIEALCRQADQALYDAKRSGRNRVVLAREMVEKIAAAAE
jgi:hypothetical protein